MMGDENTLIPIKGYSYIKVRIHSKVIRIHALYVPQMGNTCLYSIKQHTKYQGCTFFAKAQQTSITFPSFLIYPRVTTEIDVLMMKPTNDESVAFDEQQQVKIPITNPTSLLLRTNLHLLLISPHIIH
jgi:hypothetical protein